MRRLEVTGGGDSSLHRSEVRGDVWSGLSNINNNDDNINGDLQIIIGSC